MLVAAWRSFSALQRAENSSTLPKPSRPGPSTPVSVLFSEPKIPQPNAQAVRIVAHTGSFSALQRAENSSTNGQSLVYGDTLAFQCSSASRKFLNVSPATGVYGFVSVSVLFSEPKIPQPLCIGGALGEHPEFQCSSASRKFLNLMSTPIPLSTSSFQCSSASRKFLNTVPVPALGGFRGLVSVLFSEPKIPQLTQTIAPRPKHASFSALQRAENSSTMIRPVAAVLTVHGFSALQRAENSSTRRHDAEIMRVDERFSALQRAENSSTAWAGARYCG